MKDWVKRIDLKNNEILFFLKISEASSKPFIEYIRSELGLFEVDPADYQFASDSAKLVVGSNKEGKLDGCPLSASNLHIITFLPNPIDYALENYLLQAYKNIEKFENQEAAIPSITIEQFLEDPQNASYIDNPLWKSILGLFDVDGSNTTQLPKERQWQLVQENLERMEFWGLVDQPFFSIDLFLFCFKKSLMDSSLFQVHDLPVLNNPKTRAQLLTPTVMDILQKRMSWDLELYAYAQQRFLDCYREMVYEIQESLLEANTPPARLSDQTLEVFLSSFEMEIIKRLRRLKNFLFARGSNREKWGRYIKFFLFPKNKALSLGVINTPKNRRVYQEWLNEYTIVHPLSTGSALQHVQFSFLVYADYLSVDQIRQAYKTIKDQTWDLWELCFWGKQLSTDVMSEIKSLVALSAKVRFMDFSKPTGSNLPNLQFLSSELLGNFIMFYTPPDQISPDLLSATVEQLSSTKETPDILYYDQDKMSEKYELYGPWFKPSNLSVDMLLSVNFLQGAFYAKKIFREKDDFASINLPADDIEIWFIALTCSRLNLKSLHIPEILYHAKDTKNEIEPQNLSSMLENHLAALGKGGGKAIVDQNKNVYLTWDITNKPLVSIIIPTKNNYKLIKRCLDGITNNTNYENYEMILVDNDSSDGKVWNLYKQFEQKFSFIKIIKYNKEFNYSEANNIGAAEANGKFLLFLNNDTKPINSNWLTELVLWGETAGIGIVGPKLLYPNNTIQSAGTILGMNGHAAHVFAGLPSNSETIFGSTGWYRNYMAITGACMLIKKELFKEAGCFDQNLRIAFNDVALCLKVHERGYRILCNPHSLVYHFEGKSRSAYVPDSDHANALIFLEKYLQNGDLFYNPCLSLDATNPCLKKSTEEKDRIKNIKRYLNTQKSL